MGETPDETVKEPVIEKPPVEEAKEPEKVAEEATKTKAPEEPSAA
jgi:hypothetical protein